MLTSTATPMAARNRTGSSHESVDKIRIRRMIGTRIRMARIHSEKAMVWDAAVVTASPAAALSSPMTL